MEKKSWVKCKCADREVSTYWDLEGYERGSITKLYRSGFWALNAKKWKRLHVSEVGHDGNEMHGDNWKCKAT